MTRINSINLTGKAHAIDHKACEDALYIHDEPIVCCVADGVSHSLYGGVGAKALVKGMGSYLKKPGVISHYNSMSCEDVRADFSDKFKQLIHRLIKQEPTTTENDFSSTFLACFSDGHTLTIVHAGDGAVIGLPHTDAMVAPVILSYPDNNAQEQVYQAVHKETSRRMRVIRVNHDDFSAIVLGTDGFTNAYLEPSYQGYDPDKMMPVFSADDEELEAIVNQIHIDEQMITDDITAVIIHLNDIPVVSTVERKIPLRSPIIDEPKQVETPDVVEQTDTKKKDKKKKFRFKLMSFVKFLIVVMLLGSIGMNAFQYYQYTLLQDKLTTVQQRNTELQSNLNEASDELQKLLDEIKAATTKDTKDSKKKKS